MLLTTYSNIKIDPLDPKPEQIKIEDIAHSLSMMCRWNGQIKQFFSVAQHSIYTSYLCWILSPEVALKALLHDATEAYLGDLINPIKHMGSMGEYLILEKRFSDCIAKAFNLDTLDKCEAVDLADKLMLAQEAVKLGRPSIPDQVIPDYERYRGLLEMMKWEVLSPEDAKKAFMSRYYQVVTWEQARFHTFLTCPNYREEGKNGQKV